MSDQEIRNFIRKRIEPTLVGEKPPHYSLRKGQWCRPFEKLMRNRLIMGALRYETFQEKENKDHGYDLIGSAISRLQKYQSTGNMEHLVDVANLCMIEFACPSHSNPTWESIDDGEHVKKA